MLWCFNWGKLSIGSKFGKNKIIEIYAKSLNLICSDKVSLLIIYRVNWSQKYQVVNLRARRLGVSLL